MVKMSNKAPDEWIRIKHVACKYLEFKAVVEYICPHCGNVDTKKLTPEGVYWSIEGGVEHTCPVCGNELRLWG